MGYLPEYLWKTVFFCSAAFVVGILPLSIAFVRGLRESRGRIPLAMGVGAGAAAVGIEVMPNSISLATILWVAVLFAGCLLARLLRKREPKIK
jgi:hypothetical protein